MKHCRIFKTCVKELTRGLFFICYCYLVSTLCWLMVAPNQLVAIRPYEHNTTLLSILLFGIFSGVLLSFHGASTAATNLKAFFKKGDVINIIKSSIDLIFCLNFILLPTYVAMNNLAITALFSPVLLITLTGLFFVVTTAHYYRARQTHHALKETRNV